MYHLHRTHFKQTIEIDNLVTLYYFEFAKDYIFHGERHDFWELVYVDKGEVEVTTDDRQYCLTSGMITFHKPNEFHSFHSSRGTAPNIIVFTFSSKSKELIRFEELTLRLDDDDRNLLANIVKEGMKAFVFPFQYPLVRQENAPIGSEQIIQMYLELFLIRLLRKMGKPETDHSLLSLAKEKENKTMTQSVIGFLELHMGEELTLSAISASLRIAKTRLKDEFKKQTGQSIMKYYLRMRLEQAKTLIREETYNFSEIAERLGFNSPHYFSKAFKKAMGMNPTEYARSVKARSD
jgi:AraC-like DNA-binding protein/quercetin dioxygenase-like cupin family protein